MNSSEERLARIKELIERNGLMDMGIDALSDFKASLPRTIEDQEELRIYRPSLYLHGGTLFFIAMAGTKKSLYLCRGGEASDAFSRFSGSAAKSGSLTLLEAPLSVENAKALQELFPFTRPVSLREKRTTVGCGDRLGMASAAHLRAVRKFKAFPVLAQQSVRELDFTDRSFPSIVADAAFLVFQEGYEDGWGADGDHLKRMKDIDAALDAGTPMITLDLTEVLHPEAGDWNVDRIEEEFSKLPGELRNYIDGTYADTVFSGGETRVELPKSEARRCTLMYRDALEFAAEVDAHLRKRRGDAYDLEISIDETSSPTLPAHHLFIIKELLAKGVTVNSLAPRFIGEFQKGIDYIGDLGEFERQFAVHCAIAKAHGDYKISIHSGSDKFSVYPAIGRHTAMRVHLKTAGTSWLEAVRAVVKADPELFRLMYRRAQAYFPEALKSYHITADIAGLPEIDTVADRDLEQYLDIPESRQLIHISYGGLLRDPELKERFLTFLNLHEELHYRIIEEHMEKHLATLGVGRVE